MVLAARGGVATVGENRCKRAICGRQRLPHKACMPMVCGNGISCEFVLPYRSRRHQPSIDQALASVAAFAGDMVRNDTLMMDRNLMIYESILVNFVAVSYRQAAKLSSKTVARNFCRHELSHGR